MKQNNATRNNAQIANGNREEIVEQERHTWAGEKFCDCWKCSDKADWAGEKFADN